MTADPIEAFEAAARTYCNLIERHRELSCGELLLDVLPMLADLLAMGHGLPDVGAGVDVDTAGVPQDDWQRLFASLTALIGPLDFYRDGGAPYSFCPSALADPIATATRPHRAARHRRARPDLPSDRATHPRGRRPATR